VFVANKPLIKAALTSPSKDRVHLTKLERLSLTSS